MATIEGNPIYGIEAEIVELFDGESGEEVINFASKYSNEDDGNQLGSKYLLQMKGFGLLDKEREIGD